MNAIDSSVLVALLNEADKHHSKAFEMLKGTDVEKILLLDYVYIEVMNVLKRKYSIDLCHKFTEFLKFWNIKIVMKKFEEIKLANIIFMEKNNLSFEDCLLIAGALSRNAGLMTFDEELKDAWNKLKK
ncbi:MAG: type II toxin-antitoxin system VapC family toxin [Candidatus Gracilibacteria bacterium]|jgi:predicted nucleic acid-binding protein